MNSQLSINISIDFAEIAKTLNRSLNKLLYEGLIERTGQSPISLRVVREGLIEVSQKDEILVIEADVHVWVKMHRRRGLLDVWKDLPGLSVEETDFNLKVKFFTQIHLHPNWMLESKTAGSFIWMRKPKVGLGLLNVSISSIVSPTLKHQINTIARKIDAFILSEIDLPTRMQQVWANISTPFKLHDKWVSYFHLLDKDANLKVSPFVWNTRKVESIIATNHISTFWVQHSEPEYQLGKVPDNQLSKREDSNTKFLIYLHPKDIISYLNDNTISPSSGISIQILSSELSLNKEIWSVLLETNIGVNNRLFGKTFSAQIALNFQLQLGDEDQWILFSDFSYRLQTQQWMLRLWERYRRKYLKRELNAHLNSWLKEIQQDAIGEGRHFLEGTLIHPNAYLFGKIGKIKPIKLEQSEDYIKLSHEVQLDVSVKLLNF